MSKTKRFKCYGVNSNLEVSAAIEIATQSFAYNANKEDLKNLLRETAIAESNYGNAIYDYKRKFGRGIFQFDKVGMKQALLQVARVNAAAKIKAVSGFVWNIPKPTNSSFNDTELMDFYMKFNECAVLSAILCRFYYLGVSKPIPSTLSGRAQYWKTYYNSELGAGTPEKYIARVQTFEKKA